MKSQNRVRSGRLEADARLLEGLLVVGGECALNVPAWAAPTKLVAQPRVDTGTPRWPIARPLARPLGVAVALLLAGGVVTASVGVAPARAALAPLPAGSAALSVAAPAAVTLRSAAGALAGLQLTAARPAVAERALLETLLAVPADDVSKQALLASLLLAPADELAAAPRAPTLSDEALFAGAARLPAAAYAYEAAAVQLPALTLDVQPPPPVPAVPVVAQAQPPAPAGYVEPPGYVNGAPNGIAQPAVARPATTTTRPATTRPATTQPVTTVRATTYVVRAGDTLATIARRYYGDAVFAATVYQANRLVIGADASKIFPGQRLTLPGLVAAPVPATQSAPLPARGPIGQRTFYTIQQRDYLRWIAQRAYGAERFWPEIYQANRAVLGANPDLIYPGVRVYIP